MLLEISVGVIALSFLTLVVFSMIYLLNLRKTIKKLNKLLSNMNRLTVDVQEKVDALDVLFKPLCHIQKKLSEGLGSKSMCEKISEIMEALAQGVLLFGKIKEELQGYVKSK